MSEFLETTVDKFVFHAATDRLYSRDGLWLLEIGTGRVQIGLTDYFQQRNGDVAFVHLKPLGTAMRVGDEFAELETIKATVSLVAPIVGTLLAVNESLERAPETINADPYGTGWLAVLDAADWKRDAAQLLDAEAHLSLIRAEAEQESGG